MVSGVFCACGRHGLTGWADPCFTWFMVTYIEARNVLAGDILLYGSESDARVVFASEVERVSEYDETIHMVFDDGFDVPYGPEETVTVIR